MNDTYRVVEQICDNCGMHFYLKYYPNGTYEYTGKVCECESGFHPLEGEYSISEWFKHCRNKNRKEIL